MIGKADTVIKLLKQLVKGSSATPSNIAAPNQDRANF
jgi:hypothetical protein